MHLQSVVYSRDACLSTSLALPILTKIPRPRDCPGTQLVSNMSWCDPLSSQCWYNVSYHLDFCTTASIPSSPQLDDQGGYEGEEGSPNLNFTPSPYQNPGTDLETPDLDELQGDSCVAPPSRKRQTHNWGGDKSKECDPPIAPQLHP